jgi:hypothetical protein
VQAHEMSLLVVEENAQENEIDYRTKFVRQTAEQIFYITMRGNSSRNAAQSLISRFGKRRTSIGLERRMHRTGK